MIDVNYFGERDDLQKPRSRAVEKPDDLGNSRGELSQRGDYWLIGQPEGRFLERWLKGELSIAFRRSKLFGREAVQDGLIIQAAPAPGHLWWPSEQENVGYVNADSDQLVVLPCDIEVMEGPERLVPALVWFQRFDGGSLDFGKPLFAFDTCQWVDHIKFGGEDRKVRILTRGYAVPYGETGSEEVKGRPDAVDDRTDFSVNDRVERPIEMATKNSFPVFGSRSIDRSYGRFRFQASNFSLKTGIWVMAQSTAE